MIRIFLAETCNEDADCIKGKFCFVDEGKCVKNCDELCLNDYNYEPVCVGNDNSHFARDNVCEMQVRNCKTKGLGLRVLYKGVCKQVHTLTG